MPLARASGRCGWSGGWGTHFFLDSRADLAAILLTQREMAGGPDDGEPNEELLAASYISPEA